ncbi:DUF3365 domain-containing protein [Rheinheimera soli]|uniref:Tll0287-like domain-containing protein n=1 Tax=Rheinheimera soli TaxID=443616 RepID=A0ABU1W0H8_9GAMM|nr:DUF3365 domain-containing protein [Rheinheimera soli]MDR7121315.1 hypothetical protein [Rheinheimera soli]
MMSKLGQIVGCALIALPLCFCGSVWAADLAKISDELTTLYMAARQVVSDNQAHINNPDLGNKGLSADAVVSKTLENYQKATNKTLDTTNLSKAQKAMLDAVRQAMDENQDLINEKGTGFKGFLPAVFGRQVATNFTKTMNQSMEIKLTAPKEYVRNRANRPDKWEHNVIETMFKKPDYQTGKAFYEEGEVGGKKAFRFILPEYYGPSCLSCHGTPKGERDITGGLKEGAALNELGGAISLTIYQD